MRVQFSHRGVCVSDLDDATRFYHHALGFEPEGDRQAFEGAAFDTGAEITDVKFTLQTVRNRQGVTLQLAKYEWPGGMGSRERRPNNQYGLTHLAFYVDDMDAAASKILAFGGTVHEHTRASFKENSAQMMYCTDPDGTRIELMFSPKESARFSHSGICLADIDCSQRFYCDLLGFTAAENYELDDHSSWLDIINELKNVKLRAQMIRDEHGNTLELLRITSPDCFGTLERRPMNQYGLTHLAFWVDDIDTVAQKIQALGGQAHLHTRSHTNGVDRMFCTDPIGVRIELMKKGRAGQ